MGIFFIKKNKTNFKYYMFLIKITTPLLILMVCSCSQNTYSVHEENMRVLHNTMIKNDLRMKKKMTNLRKQGVRSYSPKKKYYKKNKLII